MTVFRASSTPVIFYKLPSLFCVWWAFLPCPSKPLMLRHLSGCNSTVIGICHLLSLLNTNGSRMHSVMSVTALWCVQWWRVSMRGHRAPLNRPKSSTYSPNLLHSTHYRISHEYWLPCPGLKTNLKYFWCYRVYDHRGFYRKVAGSFINKCVFGCRDPNFFGQMPYFTEG